MAETGSPDLDSCLLLRGRTLTELCHMRRARVRLDPFMRLHTTGSMSSMFRMAVDSGVRYTNRQLRKLVGAASHGAAADGHQSSYCLLLLLSDQHTCGNRTVVVLHLSWPSYQRAGTARAAEITQKPGPPTLATFYIAYRPSRSAIY